MLVPQKLVKALALCLIVCLSSLPSLGREGEKRDKTKAVLPAPVPQMAGKLITRGNQPVVVNGYIVGTGTTILTGSTIQTFNGAKASVQLGALGSFELSPNSTVMLSFGGDQVTGTLKRGCAMLTTNPNIAGTLTTPDGMLTKTDASKLSSVNVCAAGGEETAAAPELNNAAPTNQSRGVFGVSPGSMMGLLGAAGYFAGVGVSRAADNGSNSSCCCCCCCCCNPSPSRP